MAQLMGSESDTFNTKGINRKLEFADTFLNVKVMTFVVAEQSFIVGLISKSH